MPCWVGRTVTSTSRRICTASKGSKRREREPDLTLSAPPAAHWDTGGVRSNVMCRGLVCASEACCVDGYVVCRPVPAGLGGRGVALSSIVESSMSAWGGVGRRLPRSKLFTESTHLPPMSPVSTIPDRLCFLWGTCLRGAAYVPLVDIHGVRHLDGRFSRSTHAVYLGNFAVTDEEKLDRGQNSHDTQQIGIPTQDTHSHGSSCTGSAK